MPNIILSYRREDMDIDSIPFGLDFRENIQESLDRCDILVAVIGPRWAAPDGRGGNRLNDETDWVRIEIETALAKNIPVIPVLIDGAPLPAARDLPVGMRDLVFRQAAPLDSGRDFHPHVDRLIKVMDQLIAQPKGRVVASSAPRSHQAPTTTPAPGGRQANVISKPQAAKSSVATTPRTDAPTRTMPTRSQGASNQRTKYWIGVITLAVTSVVAGFIVGAVFGASTVGAILVTVVTLAMFYPGYAVAAKRFQDRDKPGQTALFGLVPVLIASLLQAFGFTGPANSPNTVGWICNLVSTHSGS